ncbi:MAG: DNA repair protein RadC [Gammaproteobacteria bacterium]
MSIASWPSHERPREKLLAKGAQALSDAELLAIFLRTGTNGKTAVDLARQVLGQFHDLRNLIDAGQQDFCSIKGLGMAKFVQIQAAIELGKRYLETSLQRGDVLSNPVQTRDYLTARLRSQTHEVFACLFLDNRHRIISFDELFNGTIDGAHVHPREVVRRALTHNAAAVILAHNHPSGVAEPSRADQALTRRLQDALALVDIRVLDHIIIGEGETTSFAERGLL